MKIGTVVSIFNDSWQEQFAPLQDVGFDHYELLPENESVFTTDELKEFVQETEVILHAPFVGANLVAHHPTLRNAAQDYLQQRLQPLVDTFQPAVITTHLGRLSQINTTQSEQLQQLKNILDAFPACSIENMPGGSSWLDVSYPATETECDAVLTAANAPFTFDVGHFFKQDLDVYRLLEKYLPQTVDVHIHDIVDGNDHQPLGTGELDVERFVKILTDHEYQGYLTIELAHDNVAGMIESYRVLTEFTSPH